MRTAIFLSVLLCFSANSYSATLHVPQNYNSIQDAINAANNGDTVLVAPGTYLENLDFLGKAITVLSSDGPEVTIVDGQQAESVVRFLNKEGNDSVLEGFTLTNGNGVSGQGSGILIIASSPVIQDNIIKENHAGIKGGGIFYEVGSPLIRNNAILQNTANLGGGIYGRADHAEIQDNIIADNWALLGGGTYFSIDSHCNFKGNTVSENTAEQGGGLYCYFSDNEVMITGNEFFSNTAMSGGGVYCFLKSKSILSGNYIHHNTATDFGGGVYCHDASPEIHNNILAWNGAKSGGGIACNVNASPLVVNNTLYGNIAIDSGGGLYCYHPSTHPVVVNTILWNNDAPLGPEIRLGNGTYPSELTISYSDVKGGQASVFMDPGSVLQWGAGMINAHPLFLDPFKDDFHIPYHSPCRDAGTNEADDLPETDFEGDPRIAYGIADMGADEFFLHLYYTGNATPGGSIQVKFVGLPGTTPVGLLVGSGVVDPPIPTIWGDFFLQQPWFLYGWLGTMPPEGVMVLPATLSLTPSAPYDVPMQALIGDKLSNLSVIEVK